MPSRRPVLTATAALEHVRRTCWPSDALDRVGIELEWLAYSRDRTARVAPDVMRELAHPATASITFEPGGQFELSFPPVAGIGAACAAAGAEVDQVMEDLDHGSVELIGAGLDPLRPAQRVIDAPRYAAMETFFDQFGPDGRRMMGSTAAVQVNLDCPADLAAARFKRASILGPTLAAAFANSPIAEGIPTGWRSARLASWFALDPSRTRPVPHDGDPIVRWARYVLDARVMLIRGDDGFVPLPPDRFTFERWIEGGHELGYPTLDDLDYHVTTLFPPVRPRGYLEVRMIDALPHPYWRVAVAILATLTYDDAAGERAEEAVRPVAVSWVDAFRLGLQHPDLAAAAMEVFEVSLDAFDRAGVDERTRRMTEDYYETFVSRGRSPADLSLEAWINDRELFPKPTSAVEAAWT